MREEDLLAVQLPQAEVSAQILGRDERIEGIVDFAFEKDESLNLWYLKGTISTPFGQEKETALLENEDIIDILDGSLNIDAYCQDEPFQEHMWDLAKTLILKIGEKTNPIEPSSIEINLGQYILQGYRTEKGKLLEILFEEVEKGLKKVEIPAHLRVNKPVNFIPDQKLLESLKQRIYEGTPAIAIIGPTGSGKSALAKYLAYELNQKGFGAYVIDAHARLEGDRLFDRDDFNEKGTFILEGVLCSLARETKKLGIRLLVILEEYNAFTDETRREFYRLFSDEDRIYPIQSSKDRKILDRVDFSHVQFILTANPLSSEKYLSDDLKRLSNAEIRRLVILYQDYARDRKTLKEIFKAIISKKQSYKLLKKKVPNLDKKINFELGIDLFLALNARGEEEGLGYDIGYSSVADMLWTAALRGASPNCLVEAILEHILNGIPDPNIRSLAAEKIRQATNIAIPENLILRDL